MCLLFPFVPIMYISPALTLPRSSLLFVCFPFLPVVAILKNTKYFPSLVFENVIFSEILLPSNLSKIHWILSCCSKMHILTSINYLPIHWVFFTLLWVLWYSEPLLSWFSNCVIIVWRAWFYMPTKLHILRDDLQEVIGCREGFQVALLVKNLPANAGDRRDTGSISVWGQSPGGGYGKSLQYSCLEDPMDREVYRLRPQVCKELDTTEAT